jgi:hypothetical protein
MAAKFKSQPMCEVERDEPAKYFVRQEKIGWRFLSKDAEETGSEYHLKIDALF